MSQFRRLPLKPRPVHHCEEPEPEQVQPNAPPPPQNPQTAMMAALLTGLPPQTCRSLEHALEETEHMRQSGKRPDAFSMLSQFAPGVSRNPLFSLLLSGKKPDPMSMMSQLMPGMASNPLLSMMMKGGMGGAGGMDPSMLMNLMGSMGKR